jgi:flagellar biosynthesis/type III secretory pathway protein FliH
MPYISSVERMALAEGMKQGIQQGIEQGIQQGIERGLQEGLARGVVEAGRRAVLEILVARFEHIPPPVVERLNQIDDADRLMQLVRQAATAKRLEDFALAL